jgi:hypothetical protein
MSGQARRSRRRRRKPSFAQVVAFEPGRMSPRQAMLAAARAAGCTCEPDIFVFDADRSAGTCSGAYREALRRAGGVGPFSNANVTVGINSELRVGLAGSVTPTPCKQRRFETQNPGVRDFREVSARSSRPGLVEATT